MNVPSLLRKHQGNYSYALESKDSKLWANNTEVIQQTALVDEGVIRLVKLSSYEQCGCVRTWGELVEQGQWQTLESHGLSCVEWASHKPFKCAKSIVQGRRTGQNRKNVQHTTEKFWLMVFRFFASYIYDHCDEQVQGHRIPKH